ncbi:pyruvate kinase [Candidatus Uhrbacteria bacterium]|nr:pyruvate kinase [Candidatus Uhrbacteria bacterium]
MRTLSPERGKRTKVVCTIGPATESVAMMTRLVHAGMNVARLNFSHGTHEHHAMLIRNLRRVAQRTGEPIAILQDLQGPKIRVGALPPAGVELIAGASIVLTTGTTAYRGAGIPLTYRALHRDAKPGHRILFDDGLLEVRVERVRGHEMTCTVITGGLLHSHKGMNLPDTHVAIPALTVKDRADVRFGAAQDVDWVALSFVRTAADIDGLRRMLRQLGSNAAVLAKIEKPQAITNFDSILAAVDGIMVARGDLGVEIPPQEVPIRQKEIIERCRAAGKPVIVATQMLDSMIRNPRPTRAEVSDVANAIIDHTDAVMLSGESATGKYPIEAATMLTRIAREIEASHYDDVTPPVPPPSAWEPVDVVAETAVILVAHTKGAQGILVPTTTGRTARRVARFHAESPVFAAATEAHIMRQLNLSYGVRPVVVAPTKNHAEFLRKSSRILRSGSIIRSRRPLVVLRGEPWGTVGTVNGVEVYPVP